MRAIRFCPALAGISALALVSVAAQTAPDPCRAPANKIVAENCEPGQPSTEWDVNGAGDPEIQGFATEISVNVGETISFKVRTESAAYRVDIYRLGYYGGSGARRVETITPSARLPQSQPACSTDEETRLYDCGNWAVSASWRVPADATSGVYIARLVREDSKAASWKADNTPTAGPKPQPGPHAYGANGLGKLENALKEPRASHIYFIVRDDASTSELLFQTSDTTWQAYNRWGWGSSTYGSFDPAKPTRRAYKVSLNRPYETRA
jgi:hypothetical protein